MSKCEYPHAAILIKCEELIKLLNINLNHFPKHEKYGLCTTIRQLSYEIYGLLVEGQKRYHKKTSLTNLDIKHEQLRMFVNLAFSLHYFEYKIERKNRSESEALKKYTSVNVLINELGAMIGGWIRSVNQTG